MSEMVPQLQKIITATTSGPDALRSLVADFQSVTDANAGALISDVVAACQHFHGAGAAGSAIPLARLAARLAQRNVEARLAWRAATAAGIVLGDTGDYAAAIAEHGRALRMAEGGNDQTDVCRTWNNLGAIFLFAGVYELAAECFGHVLEGDVAASFTRYCAHTNMAQCYLHLGDTASGLESAAEAYAHETPTHVTTSLHTTTLLRSNWARLLVHAGDLTQAEQRASEAMTYAGAHASPRSHINATLARTHVQLAKGNHDIALTMLEAELARARKIPAALVDTLVCLVHAEKVAKRPQRAGMYLEELSQFIYRRAVEDARRHLAVASFFSDDERVADGWIAAEMRSLASPPVPMAEWETFERFALRADIQNGDPDRGRRIGDLAQAIALDLGCAPGLAREIGAAAVVHDIGTLATAAQLVRGAAADEVSMKRGHHTTRGREILDGSVHPRALLASEIAQYHHERWDGGGYPNGLRGDAIPRVARICAAAEHLYDAIKLGDRNAACGMLQAERGGRHEPAIVDAVVQSLSDGRLRQLVKTGSGQARADAQSVIARAMR